MTVTTPMPSRPARSRLRTEALLAVGLLVFGVAVLPALIYLTGVVLLGDYPGGTHIGSFYGDLLRDLSSGSGRAWALVAGPWLLVQLGRLIFTRFGSAAADETSSTPPNPARPSSRNSPERREPTLGM